MSNTGYRHATLSALLLLAGAGNARADEWHGLLDLRAVSADTGRSWTKGGLGKSRYDAGSSRLSVGQAVLQGELDLTDSLSAVANIGTGDPHAGALEVREAWIGWNPVPTSAWKWRAKAGSFFPPTSVEIDYGSVGWTPTRTISSAAINSWIGEELRTNGVELQLSHAGRFERSPHDYGATVALFQGNDPSGTLLAWRGWSIGDRIAGHNTALALPDLPVYQADGAIPRQTRTVHPFREIDGRVGYYAGANYRYREQVELAWLHYDNRADPLEVKQGQYGWRTRFNHLSMVLRPGDGWEGLFQRIDGSTLMGPNAVAVDFQSWYALVSHQLGPGKLALRYDRFRTGERDRLPADPNTEHGHGLALAYHLPLNASTAWVTELLVIDSHREARALIGEPRQQTERSLLTSLRWQF